MTAKRKKALIVLFLVICYIGYGLYFIFAHTALFFAMLFGGIFLFFPIIPVALYMILGIILFERLETYTKPN